MLRVPAVARRAAVVLGLAHALLSVLWLTTGCSEDAVTTPGENVDAVVAFSLDSLTVSEDAGSVSIDVSLTSLGALTRNVSVTVVDDGSGSAVAGTDYAAPQGGLLVNFAAGSTSGATQSVSVTLADDGVVDGDRTVVLVLQNPINASLADPQRFVLTLADDDDAIVPVEASVAFQAATSRLAEDEGQVAVVVALATNRPLEDDVTVTVADAGSGTAVAGEDYSRFAPIALTFAAGSADGAIRSVRVSPIDDTEVEPDETVVLALQSPTGASLGGVRTHTATIADDDAVVASVAFTSATSTATEADGTAPIQVALTTSAALREAVTVEVFEGNASATAGVDYTGFGTVALTFAAGSEDGATQSLSVAVLDDAVPELDETVVASLGNVTGATLGEATTHTLTLVDDDPVVASVAFRASASTVGEADGSAAIEVVLDTNAPLREAVTADVVDADRGSAEGGADYTAVGTIAVTFPAGAEAGEVQTVSVEVLDDAVPELAETVVLELQNPAGAELGGITTHVLTLADDDLGTPVAGDDAYDAIPHVVLSVSADAGLLANDTGGMLTVSAFDATSANGGIVSVSAEGGFTYTPLAGDRRLSDSFGYTVANGVGSDTGTVTVSLADQLVWFVDNAVGENGDGSAAAPFDSLTSFAAAATDAQGDTIYLAAGAGPYEGAVTLLDEQWLVGQGVALRVGEVTLRPAGTAPVVTSSTGNAITLAADNVVEGLEVGDTPSGYAFAEGGSTVGDLVVRDVSVTGSGGVIDIAHGAGSGADVVFTSVASSAAPAEAVYLEGFDGLFSVVGTTTIDATAGGDGLVFDNCAADVLLSDLHMTMSASGVAVNARGTAGDAGGMRLVIGGTSEGAGIAYPAAGGNATAILADGLAVLTVRGTELVPFTFTDVGTGTTDGGETSVTDGPHAIYARDCGEIEVDRVAVDGASGLGDLDTLGNEAIVYVENDAVPASAVTVSRSTLVGNVDGDAVFIRSSAVGQPAITVDDNVLGQNLGQSEGHWAIHVLVVGAEASADIAILGNSIEANGAEGSLLGGAIALAIADGAGTGPDGPVLTLVGDGGDGVNAITDSYGSGLVVDVASGAAAIIALDGNTLSAANDVVSDASAIAIRLTSDDAPVSADITVTGTSIDGCYAELLTIDDQLLAAGSEARLDLSGNGLLNCELVAGLSVLSANALYGSGVTAGVLDITVAGNDFTSTEGLQLELSDGTLARLNINQNAFLEEILLNRPGGDTPLRLVVADVAGSSADPASEAAVEAVLQDVDGNGNANTNADDFPAVTFAGDFADTAVIIAQDANGVAPPARP